MTKEALRKIYKEKRRNIPSQERLRLDDLMLLQLQQFSFEGTTSLLTYWPMAHSAEPNTHLYSGYLRHFIPNLRIAYPVSNFNNQTMDAVLIDEDTVYAPNEYGIMQPKTGEVLAPTDIDLIFVPLLVCDKRGYRVGYGKGFYDRYLANCRTDAVSLGFCYFEPEETISNTHEFDIPLNYLITPYNIHEF